jgi:hypothetical protein
MYQSCALYAKIDILIYSNFSCYHERIYKWLIFQMHINVWRVNAVISFPSPPPFKADLLNGYTEYTSPSRNDR